MAVHKCLLWKKDFKCNQINELDELRGKKYTGFYVETFCYISPCACVVYVDL